LKRAKIGLDSEIMSTSTSDHALGIVKKEDAPLKGINSTSITNGNGHTSKTPVLSLQENQDGFRPLFEGSRLDRTEFVRITLQSLKELGYE
jgi:hypothetical protein